MFYHWIWIIWGSLEFYVENMTHNWWTENEWTLCLPNVTKCSPIPEILLIIHIILERTTLAILNSFKMMESSSLCWYWPRVSEAFICLQLFLVILITVMLKTLKIKLNEWNQDAKSLPRLLKIREDMSCQ